MENYKHGISTFRDADISVDPVQVGRAQAVVGTAPINLIDNPASAVNVPMLITSRADVKAKLGVCTDYANYTLMQTTLASLQKIGVAPIIMINVLDPSNPRHTASVAAEEFALTKGSTVVAVQGILLATLVVSADDETGEADVDYIAGFNADGTVSVSVTEDGKFAEKTSLKIAYKKLNPAGVTATDILGGIDEDNKRTGIELIDEVYNRFHLIPEILSAPKYSKDPTVASALEMKAELTAGFTNAVAIVDIESDTTVKPDDVKDAKNRLGVFMRWTVPVWPKVLMGGHQIYGSAIVAAKLQHLISQNGGVPTSPDNKVIPIDGVVLESGKELHLTQKQVNDYLNANGVVSFLYLDGWKIWGNNTAAYPDYTEPNNRFIKCVMVGNYLENRFKTEYLSAVGRDGSVKLIESIISNFNADMNALVPDYLAGAAVLFNKSENPMAKILEGHFVFRTRFADWTPIEYIENTFTWDSNILEEAFDRIFSDNVEEGGNE